MTDNDVLNFCFEECPSCMNSCRPECLSSADRAKCAAKVEEVLSNMCDAKDIEL